MQFLVRVLPRSSRNTLEWEQESLKAHVTAPPVEGAANEALIALLAERFAVPRRSIQILRGDTSRHKSVEIAGLTLEEAKRRMQEGKA